MEWVIGLAPKRFRFELRLAYRHLITGGGQTLLTISAVAAGVVIVTFITSLIFGLQGKLSVLLTEAIPHVTLTVQNPEPVPLDRIPGAEAGPSSTRLEQRAPQLKNIDDWPRVVDAIRTIPNVRVVAPVAQGQGFISKGANPYGVSIVGADPELENEVVPITKNLISGRYIGLGSDEIVLDYELAQEVGVATGDRVRVTSSAGASDDFTVAGIYTTGQGRGSAYVALRTGQSLFRLGTSVNTIYVKVYDIYASDAVADRVMALFPAYEAKSWTRQFPQFLSSLKVQTASAYLISGFSLVASSFAIASVLIVSVLQKSKQIGILKSMGARGSQLLRVFLLEGLGISIVGGIVGALIGTGIVLLLSLIRQPVTRVGQEPEQLFPVSVLPVYIVAAILAAIVSTVIAAVLPARRAAKLNPVDVMR